MPATKITDLLPIPEGTREPHAYQIFGLEDGEQDLAKVAKAVQASVSQLKAAKSSTDPKLWGKAARLVQEARITLADPTKKAQLDARFGIIAFDDEAASPNSPGSSDPLAAVLPTADPLAAVLPPSNPLAPIAGGNSVPPVPAPHAPHSPPVPQVSPEAGPTADMVPQSIFGIPTHPSAYSHPHADPGSAAPVVIRRTKKRRRKSSFLGMFLFAIFALGMFGLIGMLGYFLLFGPGQVAITKTDGQISITTQPVDDNAATPRVGAPGPVADQPQRGQFDPVMGQMAGGVTPPQPADPMPPANSGTVNPVDVNPVDANPVTPDNPGPAGNMTMSESSMAPTPPSMAEPPANANPPTDTSPNPQPPMNDAAAMASEPEMAAISEEMIANGEATLEKVRTLLRQANWAGMKEVAEAATEMPMSESQQAEAEALYHLADLATYYRVGIEKAVSQLSVGNDFAVTDTFRVIVVETGEDLLVVRYNQKNRSFTFDEFPFSMAHKLAAFSMPDSPAAQAAKAVYQAIAPKANDAYRKEAIGWLRQLNGEVDGVDPQRLAETIESLFGEDA